MSGYNDTVIADFRANAGHVKGFGSGLILLHSTGARSGEERINPVAAIPDGAAWFVCASLRGAPTNPAWYFNLVAHPDASIETPEGTVEVHATELTEDEEWEAAFAHFTARSAAFAQYRIDAAPRRMPILRLTPRG